tara:strand:+ start:460 stop:1248 length:789 start_codon:yes stop_codon:yes gene_type:complete
LREYPNVRLKESIVKKTSSKKKLNLISSTNNFWVSKNMMKKWQSYADHSEIDVNIYSNKQVNTFMKKNFEDDLIFEIYMKSFLPVQKIDIFRLCSIFLYGGIWLDLKSEINLEIVINEYQDQNFKGLLLCEPRKIEVITTKKNKPHKTFQHVIHNGFFLLPKKSQFIGAILKNIKKDYLYFQDVVLKNPKEGIMNLTGPHQFTRTFYNLKKEERPKLISHKNIGWVYCSKHGEFISPFKTIRHYSSLKELKIIDTFRPSNLV